MFPARSRRWYVLALILAAASWGVATVISKRAVQEIPPLTLLPIQLAASVGVLAVVIRFNADASHRSAGDRRLGWLGILNPGLAYSLSLLGLVYISASLSVLLWAVEPLLILVLAHRLLGERVGRRVLALSLVAVAGMLLVVYQPASGGQLVGVVLTLAGVACCAVYTIVARKLVGTADSTLRVVAVQQAYALAFAVLVFVGIRAIGGAPLPLDASPAAWSSAVISGLLYYATAYWLYLSGLRGVPASIAATSFYLIPVFGIAAGAIFLSERLDAGQWVGVGVVVIAVLGIVRRPGEIAPEAARAG